MNMSYFKMIKGRGSEMVESRKYRLNFIIIYFYIEQMEKSDICASMCLLKNEYDTSDGWRPELSAVSVFCWRAVHDCSNKI